MYLLLFVFFGSMSVLSQLYTVQLDPWGDDSIRIRITPYGQPIKDPPYSALKNSPPLQQTTILKQGPNALSNGNLQVDIDPTTGVVTATRLSDAKIILQSTKLAFDNPTVPTTLPGEKQITITFAGHGSGEKIYGLGEHRTGKVNQMPFSKRFSDSQNYGMSSGTDVSIPWYSSSIGYGFVWNLPSLGTVNISETAILWSSLAAYNADFWITTISADLSSTASPYANLLQHYTDASGHASPMPDYATGFFQSKHLYRNQTQLLDVAKGYVDRGLPLSVIVINYGHWVNWGDWSFNPVCWPDPQGMVNQLRTLGVELMVTFWPFQTNTSQHWNEFLSNNYLVPLVNGTLAVYDNSNFYLYDSTNPAARDAVWRAFSSGYWKYGIKAIWLDASEPEHSNDTHLYHWKFQGGTDAEVGEAWITEHIITMAEGMKEVNVSDYFLLARSAWGATGQYGASLWSGDIDSTFQELAIQVRVAQGVAMSGIELWTSDIGGFYGGNSSDPVFQDLIVRWFQFGAFCPLFRLHGWRVGGPPADECGETAGDNEVWNLASDQEHYDAMVRVMYLRENLRGYVKQINQETVKTGLPMLRPMFLQFPGDVNTTTSDVEDQFMFGSDWLVAPVVQYQAKSRTVYLPRLPNNETWVYFFNETAVGSGGNRVTMPTPIQEFPLFYRRATP